MHVCCAALTHGVFHFEKQCSEGRLLLCAAAITVTADHETFESTDAGASLTFPQQAGTIRKNGFMVIKGRPCKVRRGRGSRIAEQPTTKQSATALQPCSCTGQAPFEANGQSCCAGWQQA
jgi:hypothetical protein